MLNKIKFDIFPLVRYLVIFGVAAFVLTVFFSILSYGGYNFFGQFISELGIGKTALMFNLGLILSAILMLPLSILLWDKNSFLLKAASIVSFISFFALVGIGVFPMDQMPMHYYSAIIFFVLIATTIFCICVGDLLNKKTKYAFFGFVSFLAVVIFIVNNEFQYLQKIAVFFILLWVITRVFESKEK